MFRRRIRYEHNLLAPLMGRAAATMDRCGIVCASWPRSDLATAIAVCTSRSVEKECESTESGSNGSTERRS